MDATIKRKLLQEAFGPGQMSRDGINYTIVCPHCARDGSKKLKLAVRLDDNRYHCWVCDSKGKNIWHLVARVRPDMIQRLPVERASLESFLANNNEVLETAKDLELPNGLVPLWRDTKSPDAMAVRNYLLRRGLNNEDILRFRIMAGTKGQFRRHALFPSFDEEGKLNYYIGRCIDETNFRYRNAITPKTEIVFNEIDIDWSQTVILVEGIFDAIKCPDNCIPVLGSSLPKDSKLYRKLVSNSCNVIIAFDSDLPKKAYALAQSLLADNCDVRICFPPPDMDFGDMKKEQVSAILGKAKTFDSYSLINFKINNIRSGSII